MRRYLWLFLIVLLAGVLRIRNLASYPPGFTPDEAAFGYNAYSLLLTGCDEWGIPFYKLPLTNLESFGDYKLPLYAFLTVPAVKIFGLNEFATRLPNAIFGTLAVLVIFVLAKKTWPKSASFAALLLAISPWGIQLSRGAFEANLVTMLLPLFLALFLSKKYFLAGLILVLNFYSYHSARFLSLILVPLFIYKSKNLINNLFLIILLLPGLLALLGSGGSRSTDVSILSPTDGWKAVADRRFEAVQSGLPDTIARLFSNKATSLASQFTKNYLSYLSPEFLFNQGAKESTYGLVPGVGVLYPIEIFFLVAGLIYLIKNPNKFTIYGLLLLFVSIIPAALSKGPGMAANRAAPELPFLILFSAIGLSVIYKYLPKIFLYFLITLSLVNFLETYTYHNRDLYHGMLYGRKETLLRVAGLSHAYQKIFVSRSLSEPHIYVAFFNKLDPVYYQIESQKWQKYHDLNLKFLDQYDGYSLGQYTFGSLKFVDSLSLYIGLPQDFPTNIKPMFTIDYPDSYPAVLVYRKDL